MMKKLTLWEFKVIITGTQTVLPTRSGRDGTLKQTQSQAALCQLNLGTQIQVGEREYILYTEEDASHTTEQEWITSTEGQMQAPQSSTTKWSPHEANLH